MTNPIPYNINKMLTNFFHSKFEKRFSSMLEEGSSPNTAGRIARATAIDHLVRLSNGDQNLINDFKRDYGVSMREVLPHIENFIAKIKRETQEDKQITG